MLLLNMILNVSEVVVGFFFGLKGIQLADNWKVIHSGRKSYYILFTSGS
jgi:hypothetical protein